MEGSGATIGIIGIIGSAQPLYLLYLLTKKANGLPLTPLTPLHPLLLGIVFDTYGYGGGKDRRRAGIENDTRAYGEVCAKFDGIEWQRMAIARYTR